jgi:hypothetical protein
VSSSANITGGVLQILGIGATTPSTSSSPEALIQMLDVSDGTVLRGTANGRNPQGATLIQTEAGELSVKTDIFIKRGVEVAIQVERRQNETLGRLISIDGKSVPKYMEQLAAQAAATADDSVQTSQLGTATKAGALPSASIVMPEEVIPARVEAVLLSKPAPIAVPPATTPVPATPAATASAPAASISTAAPTPAAAMPLPMSPALETAFAQASNGSRVLLDVVGVTFPSSSATTSLTAPLPAPASAANVANPTLLNASPPTAPQAISAPPLPPASAQPELLPATGTPVAASPTSPAPMQAGFSAYQRVALTGATPAPVATSSATVMATPAAAILSAPPLQAASPPSVLPTPSLSVTPPQPSTPGQTETLPITNTPTAAPLSSKPMSILGETAKPAPYMPGAPSLPAGSLPVSASQGSAQPVFSAMVIGSTGPQEIILQTPIGSLKMMNTSPLPQGTQLQVRVTQILPPPIASDAGTLPLSRPLQGFSQALEGMEEFAALTAHQPRLPGAGQIPMPGKQLMSDALFLLAALKGGDLKRWIGDAQHNDLEIKGSDLLKRLGNDFATLRSGFIEAREPQGWNLLTLPLHTSFIEPVRMFYKRHRKDSQTLQNGDSEHFLVDMVLSRFGRFQLDGMVKKEGALQFDLVIRSEQALATAIEQDIRQIYKDAAEISGFQGTIAFRHGAKACVALPIQTAEVGSMTDHSIVV